MKKLFFTAIALVAFSGVSMASTIDKEQTLECKDDKGLTCEQVAWMRVTIDEYNLNQAIGECYSSAHWNYLYNPLGAII
jgi:hypothetical protein